MRKSCLVLLAFVASAAAAQQTGVRGVPDAHATVNFAQLAARLPQAPVAPQPRVVPRMKMPPRKPAAPIPTAPAFAAPAAPIALVPSPAPTASFDAQDDNGTSIPPDTMGGVGPNHLVVPLNTGVRIQDRNGAQISFTNLTTWWSAGIPGVASVFDPRILYDPNNNRWIFAAVSGAQNANSAVLIAVSATSDPTGTWHMWQVKADSNSVNWADYPNVGFNSKWIVVTVNMFTNSGAACPGVTTGSFCGAKTYIFSTNDLYSGGVGAFTLITGQNNAQGFDFTWVPVATYDPAQTAEYLVQDWDDFNGRLKLTSITGAIGSEVLSTAVFPQAASTWGFCADNNTCPDFAPQQGSTAKINTGDSRILNALYRGGSLWAAHTVFLPTNAPTHTAAQWWQFLPNGTVQQFGRVEDTSPTNPVFYAYPTIAVNSNGDALLGFSTFSANQFASAGYAFRAATDTASTMRTPGTLKAGLVSYNKTFGGTENRWGDYSATQVDPVNDLDFWTVQEYAALGSPQGSCSQSSCWGTWWGKFVISPPPPTTKKRPGQLTSF